MFNRLLFLFLIIAQNTLGHELKPAIANLELTSQSTSTNFSLKIQLNLEFVIAGIESNHKNTNDSINSKKYNELRKLTGNDLKDQFKLIQDDFLNNIYLLDGRKKIQFSKIFLHISSVSDLNVARETKLILSGSYFSQNNNLEFGWNPKYGDIILRVNKDNSELFTKYLKKGSVSKFSTDLKKSFIYTAINYFTIGFLHIIPKGLDHILFVIGLFLFSTKLKPLLIQISAFTLAHTLTIFLGVLNLVTFLPSVVEPIIAISISYIALENIFFQKLTFWRPVVVFIFGLLHGLGFATILEDVGLVDNFFITSLLFFNLGVEFGQLFIVIFCFVFLRWFYKKKWYKKLIKNLFSFIIAMIGFYWFLDRIIN